jgi:hypothetical protein
MSLIETLERVQVPSKANQLAVPVDDQLSEMLSCWALLDLEPTDEFQFEDPCAESSPADECERNEESSLPPPLPYFDRRERAPHPAPMIMQGVFSRIKSSPISQLCGPTTSNKLMQRKGMTQSMPNLYSSRSMYNRGIGYSVLSSFTECEGQPGKHAVRARLTEFEALLEGL